MKVGPMDQALRTIAAAVGSSHDMTEAVLNTKDLTGALLPTLRWVVGGEGSP